MYPPFSDGTDVNAVARTADGTLMVTADDFGLVKLFRYPCIVPRAQCRTYYGHSSHVTNVVFVHDDAYLISTGGNDRAVFQWRVITQ